MCDHHVPVRAADARVDRRRFLSGAAAAGGTIAAVRLGVASASSSTDKSVEGDGMGEDAGAAGTKARPAVGRIGGRTSRTRASVVAVPAPPIITRAQWGANESIRSAEREFAPIRKFVVHHTAGPTPSDPAAMMREIEAYHVLVRGWADVAYNFVIDQWGTIYEGRWARDYASGELHDGEDRSGNGVVGAHTLHYNVGSVGVCLMGTFDSVSPTPAALDSLARVITWKMGPRGLTVDASDAYTRSDGVIESFPTITGHRDLGATLCPGYGLYRQLGTVRAKVAARLRQGLVGYRILFSDGAVTHYGGTADLGDPRRYGVSSVAAIAAGDGPEAYYVMRTDGGMYPFGGAVWLGSLPRSGIRARAVDLAVNPAGSGYWILTDTGSVYAFGGVRQLGSLPGVGVHTVARKILPTPSGKGYRILGYDGGVFCFGDAGFYGSVPGLHARTSAVDFAVTPSGRGYWVLGADGSIFSFGDATFHGSIPGMRLRWRPPAVAIQATPDGGGYHVLASDGGIYSFGSAPFFGSASGSGRRPIDLAPAIST